MQTGTAITWEEFLAAGQEGQRWEWVDGEVEFMSPVNLRHEAFLALLMEFLVRYCRSHPKWICFTSNGVFTMASGNWRLPDASLVRRERFPGGQIPTKADFAPDVAFETLNLESGVLDSWVPSVPCNLSPVPCERKRLDYQQSGVIQVWFDLEKRLVELIYPDRPLQYYQEGQTLTIDAVPGFALELKDLFSI
jgi:Uma2 family endonuclease